jgi:hypothetical protein
MTPNADSAARHEVRHAVFNPTTMSMGHSPLAQLVAVWERDDWRLVQVIPHHQYESVAVFERTTMASPNDSLETP